MTVPYKIDLKNLEYPPPPADPMMMRPYYEKVSTNKPYTYFLLRQFKVCLGYIGPINTAKRIVLEYIFIKEEEAGGWHNNKSDASQYDLASYVFKDVLGLELKAKCVVYFEMVSNFIKNYQYNILNLEQQGYHWLDAEPDEDIENEVYLGGLAERSDVLQDFYVLAIGLSSVTDYLCEEVSKKINEHRS